MRAYLFPLNFAFNSFSLPLLVVVAAVSGRHALAADLSLAQAAMIAFFFSFSANARNLILKSSGVGLERSLSQMRLLLAPVLAVSAFLVSVFLSNVGALISLAIVLRQLSEWFSELELARMEKEGDPRRAKLFLGVLVLPLLAALLALLLAPGLFVPALFLWAAAPLALCLGGISGTAATLSKISIEWRKILPNFGSTLIIGTVVFFFRLLIAGFAGKEVAGQLFAAFALGSIVGSLYERTIGPSFKVSSELSSARERFFRLAWILPVAGAALAAAAFFFGGDETYLGRNAYLVGAVGFSLMGGFVMLGAQNIKIDILHSRTRDDVFMADLLSNFAILISVPVVFLLFGKAALMFQFLTNAVLVYAAYWLVDRGAAGECPPGRERVLHMVMAFAVVTPLFFQLGGGVYRGGQELYDWGGRLAMHPLPLSVFIIFPMILFMHSFRNLKTFSVLTFLVFAIMMCGTMVASSGDEAAVRDKLFLSLQYLLPFFGLILAEHAGASGTFLKRMAAAFFCVSAAVAALQLGFAFYSGVPRIQPSLGFFSVYNNLQYAAVIFQSAYLLALFTLYRESGWRMWLLAALPVMSLHAAFSGSFSAAALLLCGLALFWAAVRPGRMASFALLSAAFIFWGGAAYSRHYEAGRGPQPAERVAILDEFRDSWKMDIRGFYLRGIGDADAKTLAFGHPTVPERRLYPSAHNYYLDLMYNFGAFTLLPVLVLIIFTVRLAWKSRAAITLSPPLAGLVFVVFYSVIIENSFKVAMRQPYSGIYVFFLWGLLISYLRAARAAGSGERS